MNKQNVTDFFKGVQSAVKKHSPEILIGVGVASMITSTVRAVKATPKALKLIEEKKREEKKEELTVVETVKAAWKPYVPAVITGVTGAVCVIGGNSVHLRRNAALATAYKLSETALTEYKEKVIETIGDKKEKIVREKLAQDKVDKTPTERNEVIITGGGDVLFLEPISMRYFYHDIEQVRRIINDINYRLTSGMEEYISLSEFYDEIGLSHTRNSDDLGWNLGRDGQIKIDFPVAKADNGKPCLVLEYEVEPRYEYHKLM